MELCGHFEEEKTRKIIEITEVKISILYVTHFQSEDEKFIKFFGQS